MGALQGPRWSRDHTLLTSAARTTSGQTNPKNVGEYREGVFFLEVTSISATGDTLDVKMQYSPDQGATWFDSVYEFSQVSSGDSTPVRIALAVPTLGNFIRFDYTIAGSSPSFTFSIKASLKA